MTEPSIDRKMLPGGYISVSEAWRAMDPRSGESVMPYVPTRRNGKAVYLAFVHGFRNVREGLITIDRPSMIRVVDAQSGALVEDGVIPQEGGPIPAATVDSGALARLTPAVDALAPAFFDGRAEVPEMLRPIAAQYRLDFPKAIHPDYIGAYKQHAPDWFQWVGL